MAKRLAWRKEKRDGWPISTPRGVDLTYGGQEVGYVRWCGSSRGWYWVVSSDSGQVNKGHNSLWDGISYEGIEEAKAACRRYFLDHQIPEDTTPK